MLGQADRLSWLAGRPPTLGQTGKERMEQGGRTDGECLAEPELGQDSRRVARGEQQEEEEEKQRLGRQELERKEKG